MDRAFGKFIRLSFDRFEMLADSVRNFGKDIECGQAFVAIYTGIAPIEENLIAKYCGMKNHVECEAGVGLGCQSLDKFDIGSSIVTVQLKVNVEDWKFTAGNGFALSWNLHTDTSPFRSGRAGTLPPALSFFSGGTLALLKSDVKLTSSRFESNRVSNTFLSMGSALLVRGGILQVRGLPSF